MPKYQKKSTARASESLAIHALLCGCAAEIFLFIVRRYANGKIAQVVIWNERYLPMLAGIGTAILAVGAIWTGLQRGDRLKRMIGLYLCGIGAFVAAVSLLSIYDLTFLDRLIAIVPIAACLVIVWGLYDRACAVSLTALTTGIVSTWLFSRTMQPFSPYLTLSRLLAVVLLAALAGLLYLLWNGTLKKRFLSSGANTLPLYVSFALTFAGVLASVVNVGAAGYAMWTLALTAFGLLVYYTVKQI